MGQIGTNGSVWWQIVHHDREPIAAATPVKGSNRHQAQIDDYVRGRDPIPTNEIGEPNWRGYFRVRLRLKPGANQATRVRDELNGIRNQIQTFITNTTDDELVLVFHVPAINPADPPDDPNEWEINVDW